MIEVCVFVMTRQNTREKKRKKTYGRETSSRRTAAWKSATKHIHKKRKNVLVDTHSCYFDQANDD